MVILPLVLTLGIRECLNKTLAIVESYSSTLGSASRLGQAYKAAGKFSRTHPKLPSSSRLKQIPLICRTELAGTGPRLSRTDLQYMGWDVLVEKQPKQELQKLDIKAGSCANLHDGLLLSLPSEFRVLPQHALLSGMI